MTSKLPPDESNQCANIYFAVQELPQDALLQGYHSHAIAGALLEAARDTLADNQEFLTVYDRFSKRRNLDAAGAKISKE